MDVPGWLEAVSLDQTSLFLNLDGTLADVAPRPDDVGPNGQRTRLLRELHLALGGRLAIVSGRIIDDVDRVVQCCVPCVAGIHGLERRDAAGRVYAPEPHPLLERVYSILHPFVKARPPLHLEFKTLGVAIHYRQAPEMKSEVLGIARRLAWATGLRLQKGRKVVELRSPGADKGQALCEFMAELPFSKSRPIFIGDGVTDEDGFAAARSLGGVGVLVGRRCPTQATARLRDVSDVLMWLGHSLNTGIFEFEGCPPEPRRLPS
jgi:trehalose 6-phosphate phosphatase